MKHYGDITKLNGADLPIVDVVTGGSPCQDLSVAGKRAGLDGARSGLFMEQIRIIKEMREHDRRNNQRSGVDIRPRYMVWENVPGAFSSNKGEDFRAVLEETAKVADETAVIPEPPKGKWTNSGAILGDGWSIAWRVFDAQFWGVPQRRRRIYLIADFGGDTAPEILFKREGLPWDIAESGSERERIAKGAERGIGEASGFDGYNSALTGDKSATIGVNCGMSTGRNGVMAGISYGVVSKGNGDAFLSEERHTSLTQGGGQAGQGYPCVLEPIAVATQQGGVVVGVEGSLSASGFDMYNQSLTGDISRTLKTPVGGDDIPVVLDAIGFDGYNSALTGDKSATIGVNCGMSTGRNGVIDTPTNAKCYDMTHANDVIRQGEIVPTLQHRMGTGGNQIPITMQIRTVRENQSVRRLTPTECERLQGFPDGWTNIPDYIDSKGKKKTASDSARYKALGNSVAIPNVTYVLFGIAERYGFNATIGSLFDGIGGFPLVWEGLCGKGTAVWASEIEEFPIAVTKWRFGDE